MGKPYKYTRLFKYPKTYPHKFWGLLEKDLINLIEYQKIDPIDKSKYNQIRWDLVINMKSESSKDLYNIIKLIAKSTGTKIMWLTTMKSFIGFQNILLIIGEENKIMICKYILDFMYKGITQFQDYARNNERERIKRLGYDSMVQYVNLKVSQNLSRIHTSVRFKIDENDYELRKLENYIMGQFKLDYKRYHQITNIYTNALSKHFHHRRMML